MNISSKSQDPLEQDRDRYLRDRAARNVTNNLIALVFGIRAEDLHDVQYSHLESLRERLINLDPEVALQVLVMLKNNSSTSYEVILQELEALEYNSTYIHRGFTDIYDTPSEI